MGAAPVAGTLSARTVKARLRALADPKRAVSSAWFFKTGPGQYGEGDRFLGIAVPEQRKVARQYRELPLAELAVLAGQCLARRIADAATLTAEVDAWRRRRNTHNAKAKWHFTTADARVKLKSLYPAL